MKTCRVEGCKTRFANPQPFVCWCSPECGTVLSIARLEKKRLLTIKTKIKEDKRADRIRREKLDGRKIWLKKAEAAVNKYVKLRDFGKGCISCHLPANWQGKWQASHFRSVGAASSIRYNLWNINKSCLPCNMHKGGNIIDYEPRLRALIGDDKVAWLRAQNNLASYDVAYLQRLAKVFNKKARRQEKRNSYK